MEEPRRWDPAGREEAYQDLDHPADVFLEVWGGDLPSLFENALFALYDHLAELETFDVEREEEIRLHAKDYSEALRALLAEALYRFETECFVAIRAEIAVDDAAVDQVGVTARLKGEVVDKTRHRLLTEVKAVTYHQLAVERAPEGGWKATLLFDV
ncbi:MAG: archease [Actinobacteria bacterium]|nr:archease [Actinomycetota bacterium]